MQIWPAIDLRGGKCVRLQQGDYQRETVFGEDPAAMWVMEVEDRSAVGWIRGEPPAGTNLLSVELSQAMPGLDSAVAADDADLAAATPAPQDH